jgi:hypothetical protein
MIRRRRDDQFLLISQNDHALLAGQMARHVGNARFSSPLPNRQVICGIEMHDCAWAIHDDAPTINTQGLPRHVFESQIENTLQIWSASVDRAGAVDPYCGLLVSLHANHLSYHAMSRIKDNVDPAARLQLFQCSRFQHRQVELQEEFRQTLGMRIDRPLRRGLAEPNRAPDEDLLIRNFRLLEFLDQLSLNLCFDEPIFHEVDHVYPRQGQPPVKIHLNRVGEAIFAVDPWPFDQFELEFSVPCRAIAARNYLSDEDLRANFASAKTSTIPVRLRSC